ncbi:DivIVA domain-containing protein [Williamsoniiplasma somnilux]|uniref:DivIVA domain-containing protein n=1 Tax=Williamsoniiplasma somnilux TaxID=215578 RepID=A0A2K8NYC9_9MOLU|nr:DivIVA domain-containing protein [Williamsoniiplasma somnilux]ATZ18835.1 DivIVA domain-containing protein [Williamsoniiplasma somnilux]
MNNEINKFNAEDIYNKSFTIEIKGYKAEEVEDFLDDIQKDYVYFSKIIEEYKKKNESLNNDLFSLKNKYENMESANLDIFKKYLDNIKEQLTSSDLISRISNMESTLQAILNKINK